jgi:type I restriction enzyme M protein
MYAAVTLVEFDNRITRQRWSQIITAPRERVVRSLAKCYVDTDPDTGEAVPFDSGSANHAPAEACVFVAPKGAIRVLIYPTWEPEGAEVQLDEDLESFLSLLERDGDELEAHYRHMLEELGKKPGMLGEIFKKAKPEIQNPALLRRLTCELIDREQWTRMEADVKGDIYEGLLSKSAAESPKGAGQYFTPRELIKGIVDVMQPTADETIIDPACGTAGFLVAAHEYVLHHQGRDLDKDQKKHLETGFVFGADIVPNTARLAIMNLYLHGIDADPCPIRSGLDSLASPPSAHYGMVMTNPPFGKKSSITIVTEEGDLEKEDSAYERQDFWVTTKNKQLNFLQHVKTLLKVNGRCAIVVPDNVLFEGGAGETVRRNLMQQCDVHTLLRLPTGSSYEGDRRTITFYQPGGTFGVQFGGKTLLSSKAFVGYDVDYRGSSD